MAHAPSMHTAFETRVRLPAPPDVVWELLSDMTTWRQWTRVFDVRDGAPRPAWREGVRLSVGPALLGVRLWAEVRIVEARRPRVLAWEGTLWGIAGRHGFVFEPDGEAGCRMTHWEACGGLGGRLAVWSGAWWLLQRRFHRFNEDLRAQLEAGGS